MYCSKCGTQLDDNAAFCSGCGAQTGNSNQAPAQQAPVYNAPASNTAPTNLTTNGLFTIPKLSGLISIGAAVLMFIFMFLPWFSYGIKFLGTKYSESFSIFHSDMFELSALLGLAKVLGIINIIVFVLYLALQFIDVKKLVPQIPANIDCKKLSAYAFGGIYALEWLFTLIGIIATKYVGIAACFIITLVWVAVFVITVFKEDLVENLLGNITKK